VSIDGEIDLAAVNSVRVDLDPLLADEVIVDLTGITFIESSGLQCLLHMYAEAAQRGGRLVLGEVSSVVRLLEVSGVGEALARGD
jgi:anti-anti-sigma factor